MEENNLVSQDLQQKANKRDYILPALFFLALFFGFFVLITMQRLSKSYFSSKNQPSTKTTQVTQKTVENKTNNTEDSKNTTGLSQTLKADDQKQTSDVTDDLLNEIDKTQKIDVNASLNDNGLDDLSK
jgi:hypothetical protein